MNLRRKHEKVLAAATRPTRDRIAADEQRASEALKPLLRHLKTHLFESDLRFGRWLATFEKEDRLLSVRFEDEFGVGPSVYLRECRLEVAARLLRDTEISITAIAALVGYAGRTAFSGSFQLWWGVRPMEYRAGIRRTEESTGKTPEHFFSASFLSDAFSGRLPLEQVQELFDRLQAIQRAKLAPPLPANPGPLPEEAAKDAAYERALAEQVWEALRQRPFREQQRLVRRQVGFETAALFELLRRKSLEQGRKDRQRGIELAELALASLDCCPRGQEPDLRVRARILLGNARRLALDYPGAEAEILLAETEWARGGEQLDHSVEADLLHTKASLRRFQRRYSEALHLINQALAIFRAMDRPVALARSLISRAVIRQESMELQPTIADLEEALRLLKRRSEPYLEAVASSRLAVSQIRLGEFAAARDAIMQAEQLHSHLDDPLGRLQLCWLTAQVEQGEGSLDKAERLFRQTHADLVAIGERGHAAVLSLDLAILYAYQRRTQEALDLVAPAISILEEFEIDPAALTALDRLTSALAAPGANLADLQEVRALLDQLVRDYPARKAPPAKG